MDARHCMEVLTTADNLRMSTCRVHTARGASPLLARITWSSALCSSAQHIPEIEAKTIVEAPVKMVGKAMPV
ncbi:hypothetical protein PC129_g23883 [Phytophthora cactorum]|uniref:Uncharacterized protein n=2 Tax=Phytophthora cactorum TaxID=29920 RepID=A0A8T1JEU8_9STRA|nr:hypothetical protein Pcac1_g18706 [Phytophthora cactorum]KAG2791242.1 hypothetical protein PC111_g24020 [Phytophthora cactorum]KAG2791650.1 hypothetical protein PC112_g24165 [Phytophthora cactorum]KAG2871327.1 hypothetical protein PC114_g26976 [Phytophthora cactorum]KAG2874619.1 hypothetical protein PC115_g24105 [Phytophthora cactorum]